MKTTISGFGLIVMLVIAITCQSMIINYSTRQEELTTAVNAAMFETQKALRENTDDIRSEEDYVNVFMTNLLGKEKTNATYDENGNHKQNGYISSKSKISIKVYSADYENGFLDVAVTETYGYKNKDNTNSKRKITVRRSSIIETFQNKDGTDDGDIPPNPSEQPETAAYFSYVVMNDDIQLKMDGTLFQNGKIIEDTNSIIPKQIDLDKKTDTIIQIPITSGTISNVSFTTEAINSETSMHWEIKKIDNGIYYRILVINLKNIEGNITLRIE